MNKLNLVFLLIIIVVVPTATAVAWQAQQPQPEEWTEGHTESEAIETALDFLKNSPTFKFDGISESIDVLEVSSIRPPAPEWLVTIEFECRHAGYGDRTGDILAEVVTSHTIVILVKEGEVVKADIDDKWDELHQCEVLQTETQPPEFGRDKAINYIIFNHEELDLQTPFSWEKRNLAADPPIPGLATIQYISNGWTVNVTYPVVPDPTYTVKIEYKGDISFHWEGTVDQDGNVDGRLTSVDGWIHGFYRDAAVDYILKNHEELKGLQTPSSWETINLTPEGWCGSSKIRYIGEGWTVNVTYPVVLHPICTVEVEYRNGIGFRWEGTVDQDGNVVEMHFAAGEQEAPTTITGEYLPVGNPCTTTPCLPGIVYAVLADGRYYYLTVEGHWIWENRPWDGYIPTERDHVKVTGYVSERLDVNGNCFYEIEVVSLIEYEYFSEFRVVVNGVRELDVLVPVNITDGLTREEAEQIAESTFVQVMGKKVIHRLDTLTVDENSIEAHHTWGFDESDMGHVFDMTVDIALRLIAVTHCR